MLLRWRMARAERLQNIYGSIAALVRDPFRVLLLGRRKLYDFPSTRLRGAPTERLESSQSIPSP